VLSLRVNSKRNEIRWMTPQQRVLAALAGEMPDRVQFVVWNNKLPDEAVTRQLLGLEVCTVNNSRLYTCDTPQVGIETETLEPIDGAPRIHNTFHTPAGEGPGKASRSDARHDCRYGNRPSRRKKSRSLLTPVFLMLIRMAGAPVL